MNTNRFPGNDDGGGRELVPPRETSLQRAALSYKRGVEAMERQNWDFAREMFAVSVKFCPDKLNFRQLLRNCTCKRYQDNKTGADSLTRLNLTGIRERVRRALADWNWRLADLLCEEGLTIDPWDIALHVALAEAARAQGFLDIAKYSLAFALSLARRSREINLRLIQILREMGDHDQADDLQRWLDDLDNDDDGSPEGVR